MATPRVPKAFLKTVMFKEFLDRVSYVGKTKYGDHLFCAAIIEWKKYTWHLPNKIIKNVFFFR